MRTLITGASGFVGRALVTELLRCGHAVRAVVRRPAEFPAGIEAVNAGEITESTDWSAALRGVETVFHLAARVHRRGDAGPATEGQYRRINCDATVSLARAAIAAGARHFVFASSVKVMGETSADRPLTESDTASPQDAYGRSKFAAEQELARLADQIRVSIVRSPLVYGPGVRANFLSLLRLADSPWPLPLGAARSPRSMVYAGNLVDAMIACATVAHDSPATYFVSDGQDLAVAELIALLRQALGRPIRLFALPAPLLATAARVVGRADAAQRLFSPLQVDIGRITRELGWRPPHDQRTALRETAGWLRDVLTNGPEVVR